MISDKAVLHIAELYGAFHAPQVLTIMRSTEAQRKNFGMTCRDTVDTDGDYTVDDVLHFMARCKEAQPGLFKANIIECIPEFKGLKVLGIMQYYDNHDHMVSFQSGDKYLSVMIPRGDKDCWTSDCLRDEPGQMKTGLNLVFGDGEHYT